MKVHPNVVELKYLATSLLLGLVLYFLYEYTLYYPLTLTSLIWNSIIAVLLGALTLLYMREFSYGRGFTTYLWVTFVVLLILKSHDISPVLQGVPSLVRGYYLFLMPIAYSIVYGSLFSLSRFLIGRRRLLSLRTGRQYAYASLLYLLLMYLTFRYYTSSDLKIVSPERLFLILGVSYLLSNVIILFNKIGYNLAIAGILFYGVYPLYAFLKTSVNLSVLILLGILTAFSFAYFSLTMRVETNYRGIATGNVVSSISSDVYLPLIVVVVWSASSYFLHLSSINSYDFLVVLFPIVLGSVVMDTVKGLKADVLHQRQTGERSYGVICGVGMADGLWLKVLAILMFYLLLGYLGLLEALVFYVFLSIVMLILARI
ncbi:hypothetical protein HS7_14100 [Sulfolobales archaeon HS-7]|nr:hypothetical protein HS7_14100 [Sulfolobales archaeon HS-7]